MCEDAAVRLFALFACCLFACRPATPTVPREARWTPAPPLPEPLSNNAVAAVANGGRCTIVSALGLVAPRAEAIVSRAYAWTTGDAAWRALPDVPGPPRLAASAVTLRGSVYVLGGYDVAPDRRETSHAEMARLDPKTATWTATSPLLRAIDDAVALAWQDRWIVVISGWSDDAPVHDVQIYDVEDGTWRPGTPFPGAPVFGHAAAIHGDELVVIDGVTKTPQGYRIVAQSWMAKLDPTRPGEVAWRDLGAHPGPPRYRAAGGSTPEGTLVFAGGTADPYNFDGLSYLRHAPSAPEPSLLLWKRGRFEIDTALRASMDHRALASCGPSLYLAGGMLSGPRVSSEVWRLDLP